MEETQSPSQSGFSFAVRGTRMLGVHYGSEYELSEPSYESGPDGAPVAVTYELTRVGCWPQAPALLLQSAPTLEHAGGNVPRDLGTPQYMFAEGSEEVLSSVRFPLSARVPQAPQPQVTFYVERPMGPLNADGVDALGPYVEFNVGQAKQQDPNGFPAGGRMFVVLASEDNVEREASDADNIRVHTDDRLRIRVTA